MWILISQYKSFSGRPEKYINKTFSLTFQLEVTDRFSLRECLPFENCLDISGLLNNKLNFFVYDIRRKSFGQYV